MNRRRPSDSAPVGMENPGPPGFFLFRRRNIKFAKIRVNFFTLAKTCLDNVGR